MRSPSRIVLFTGHFAAHDSQIFPALLAQTSAHPDAVRVTTTTSAPALRAIRTPLRSRLLAVVVVLLVSWLAATPAAQAGTAAPARAVEAHGEEAVWVWPLEPQPRVLRKFDLPFRYGAGHRGLDLAADPGAEVRAPDDGTVHFVGVVVDRPVLSIDHGDGILSSFEPVTTELSPGDHVTKGQLIGHLAETPRHAPSGGLHLGARRNGEYIDPRALLGEIPRAVLLPLGRVS